MAFGEPVASSMTARSAAYRFREFTRAVYERRVVPVLGAGVSSEQIPLASELIGKLKKLPRHKGWDAPKSTDSLARVAEIAIRGHGHALTCRALEISSWADMPPAPAHRYLAMLAADGVIDEMITTNYDCCIEQAWKALGRSDGLVVVSDATELHRARPRWKNASLFLYKINGCAKKLRDKTSSANPPNDEEERAAKKILLTDTQLQGFGNREERRWVRDLLRDRTRSQTLVLSGFGSDEPQVWHVVRLILEELASLRPERGQKTANGNGDPPVREPRIWVALYEERLPFHLLTALADEASIRGRGPLKHGRPDRFDNLFSKADQEFFGDENSEGLEAAAFWRKVWIEVLRRSLQDTQGPVARSFVQAALGRRPRDQRPEDASLFALWRQAVQTAFGTIPLDEPQHWVLRDGGAPGAPGIAWADDRYVTAHEEPAYWAVVVLLALQCRPDDPSIKLLGHVKELDPVVVVRYGKLQATGFASPASRHVAVTLDGSGEERLVTLCIDADLLTSLHGREVANIDDIRTAVWHYLHEGGALQVARGQERDRRQSRREVD